MGAQAVLGTNSLHFLTVSILSATKCKYVCVPNGSCCTRSASGSRSHSRRASCLFRLQATGHKERVGASRPWRTIEQAKCRGLSPWLCYYYGCRWRLCTGYWPALRSPCSGYGEKPIDEGRSVHVHSDRDGFPRVLGHCCHYDGGASALL